MNCSRNPQLALQPEKDHHRQSIWQIYIPVFLGFGLFIALCVWAAIYSMGYPTQNLPDQQSPAAQIAVIWLVLPTCLGGLIQMALLGGSVYLLSKGIRGLPPLAHKIGNGVRRVSTVAIKSSDKIAAPLIYVSSRKAGIDQFFRRIAFWKRPSQGV